MKWICEADELPPIAQPVLLAVPRQAGEFWDLKVAQLLVHYEDVAPLPVPRGSKWPTTYYWDSSRNGRETTLVTGNSWWALMNTINLPPGAVHKTDREFHYIAQPSPVFVPQAPRL